MKILIACEYSGTVRDAFAAKGHYAMSCDLLPTETNGHHYQGDIFDVLYEDWDLMIAHPPCTHLSKAGGWCWKFKQQEQQESVEFVKKLWDTKIKKICIENPIGFLNTNWKSPSQIIHPYYFGDPWMKETCIWLKGLPKLLWSSESTLFYEKTNVEPIGNWVKPGNNRPHRKFNSIKEGGKGLAKERARFFPRIAEAMANQWG